MSGTLVRAATGGDRAFIERLGKESVGASVPAFRSSSDPMTEVAFERLLHFVYEQQHVALVAEHDGQRAGFVLLLPNLPDETTLDPQAFLAYMAVAPDARRKGVGAALLEAAEASARSHGMPYLALMVTEENAAARNLYERSGYFTERRLLCKIL